MVATSTDIVYYSRFLPTYKAGGGSRRLLQLLDLLAPTNCRLLTTSDTKPSGKRTRDIFFTRRQTAKSKQRFVEQWDGRHRPYVGMLWDMASFWVDKWLEIETSSAVVMDDPIYFLPLFKKLKNEQIRIIAVCHNLESLSPDQVASGFQKNLLAEEIEVLSQCDLVITISREETFLLKNLGINTFFLPYFPPEAVRERMLNVRKIRLEATKKHFLLLGTAKNLATRQGMLTFIAAWRKMGIGSENRKLLVAGYGTEKLALSTSDNVRFLGQLSDEELDTELQTIKACLCYQAQAAGALTRISEMLFAGVPVVANSHAARTYHNQAGLVEYANFSELGSALEEVDALRGDIPTPSPPNHLALLDQVRSIAAIDD